MSTETEEVKAMSEYDARHKTMGMLESFCKQHTIQLVVVHGDPVSKARPRFSCGGKPYTPAKTVTGEKNIAARLFGIKKMEANVAVACLFFRSTRQRIDVDNLLKAVLDAGTRAQIWKDDCQVTALIGIVEYDRDNPRTVICFGDHISSLTRGTAALVPCEACGKLFFPFGKRRETARWCSRACGMTLAALVECPGCGKQFKRRSGTHKYCNGACRGLAQTNRAIEDRKLKTHCRNGHPLSVDSVHIMMPSGRLRCRRCQADAAARVRARKLASKVDHGHSENEDHGEKMYGDNPGARITIKEQP